MPEPEMDRTIPNRFIKIKVKRQIYDGKPALVIFVSDETNKVLS